MKKNKIACKIEPESAEYKSADLSQFGYDHDRFAAVQKRLCVKGAVRKRYSFILTEIYFNIVSEPSQHQNCRHPENSNGAAWRKRFNSNLQQQTEELSEVSVWNYFLSFFRYRLC